MGIYERLFGSGDTAQVDAVDNLEETGMYGWTAAAAADEAMKHAVDVPEITWKDVGNVALDFTPVIGDIKGGYETVAMIGEELEKDDPNWYLIGAMGGIGGLATIVGLVPGAGDAAQKALMSGARSIAEKSGQLAGDVTGVARAVRDGDLEFIRGWNSPSSTEGVGADVNRTGPYYSEVEEGFAGPNLVPESTRSGYKLMRKPEEGRLTSLFVNQDQDVPTGQWMDAVMPDNIFTAPNGRKYAPASTGDNIPIPDDETRQMLIATGALPEGSTAKTVKAVAARPGHHLGDAPNANHIGPERNLTEAEYNKLKDLGYPVKMNKNGRRYIKIRGDDEVWVRADVPDDVDWQSEANRRGRVKKDGTVDVRTAEITDELPRGGSYDYRQNSNNKGNWVISGQMKVQEELEREALQRTNKEMGRPLDSPTLSELDALLEPETVPATVAEQTDSVFDLSTPTTPREGPPEPYVMDGAKIASDLENTVSAQEVATGVKKPAGAKFSGLTAQQSTLLPNHYSEGLKSTQTIKPVKINWEALEGKTVFSVVGDPTSANTVTKVQGDKLITPVESQAGVEFMDKQDYGYASAQQAMASTHNEIVRAMDEDGADPLLMYLQMAEVSGDFADHTGMLIGELFKQARISSNAIPAIDEHIRKIGMDKKVPKLDSNGEKIWDAKNEQWKTESERIRPFSDFKSVADPLYMARYIAELPTGALRAGLIKGLDRHGLQQKGVPNVGDVRLALMNPDLFGKDWLSAGERLIIPDVDRGLFPTPDGLHNTYDTTIGKVGQSMKVDSDGIPMNLILQDMSEAQRARGSGGRLIPSSADYKVAEMSPRRSQQKIDAKIVDLAMSFEEMSEKYGRGAALSFAQDLLLNEKITSETIKAAKKANAKPWVLSLMAGVMATQAIMESEDGLMSPTEEEI